MNLELLLPQTTSEDWFVADPNTDGAFTKYTGSTATQAKTFAYSEIQ